MVARPKGQKKKDHVVTATDAEWARITEAADAAGMPRPHFILHAIDAWRTLTGTKDDEPPASVFRRMVQSVLVLELVSRKFQENNLL